MSTFFYVRVFAGLARTFAHEVLQKFSAAPLSTCPSCGSVSVQKLFSPEIGLSFKGSGFYITDYTRHGNGKANGSSQWVAVLILHCKIGVLFFSPKKTL
ncbi:MAG: FmdB family zinc ribbon protein [bacterium]